MSVNSHVCVCVHANIQSTHLQAVMRSLEEYEERKIREVCVNCGKQAAEMPLQRLLKCSACTIMPAYCSTECQKACWKGHKVECKANRKTTK
jgi:hypothetical protein